MDFRSHELLHLINDGHFLAKALQVVAQLGVADAVGDEPVPVTTVAQRVGAKAEPLARVLRLLASRGIFTLEGGLAEGTVSHTAPSRLLASDHPHSFRPFALNTATTRSWRLPEHMLHMVRTGEPAVAGSWWNELETDPEEARLFDAAMVAKSHTQIAGVIEAFDKRKRNDEERHSADSGGRCRRRHGRLRGVFRVQRRPKCCMIRNQSCLDLLRRTIPEEQQQMAHFFRPTLKDGLWLQNILWVARKRARSILLFRTPSLLLTKSLRQERDRILSSCRDPHSRTRWDAIQQSQAAQRGADLFKPSVGVGIGVGAEALPLLQWSSSEGGEGGARAVPDPRGSGNGSGVFSRFGRVVDVGGGRGHLLSAILDANPGVRGVLFDRPEVVEAAKAGGHHPRMEFVGGSFFEEVPPGDATLLMEVLHDWNDEDTVRILRTIRRAAAPESRLLVIEADVGEGDGPTWGKLIDIIMMTIFAGRQRARAEFARLFEAAGYTLTEAIPTGDGSMVFTGVPA